jgi:hypothetical protein
MQVMPAAKGPMQALRKAALRYPGTEEGVACEGTPIESRTVKARNKAFLFLTVGHARLKLRESLPEATKLAQKKPDQLQVGAGGWVKATLSADGSTPLDVLERWIGESYRLMAGPPVVAGGKTRKST